MASPDRYDPLPSLPQIPAFLFRKLSPRGRRVAAGLGGGLLLCFAIGVVVGLPQIQSGKQERAQAEAERAATDKAALEARLKAEQRPVRGDGPAATAGLSLGATLAAREALLGSLAVAIERDAASRVRSGDLEQPVREVECEPFPRSRGPDPATLADRPLGNYACLAETAAIPAGGATVGGSVGYPYRAQVRFTDGRFTFCKVSGRPGEKALPARPVVTVPPECGGAA